MPAHPYELNRHAPPRLPSDAELEIPRGADPESSIIGPVAGRYDLGDRIARGGMGVVYRAHDRLLNRTVAVKVLRGRFMDRPDLLRRFLSEARINGKLQHPGIVPVYEVGTLSDARPFIAMKLIEGKTLSRDLRERSNPTDNQPHLLKVFESLCQTMAYAHQRRVIHRDLKPDNLMVGAFGEVQVMDWGLAKFLDPEEAIAPIPDGFDAIEKSVYLSHYSKEGHTPVGEFQTQATAVVAVGPETPGVGNTTAGEVFGTLAYMPPEQARGAMDQVDRRSDVFSLGAILCQILTGQPPYFGPPETLREQAREGKLFGAYLLLDRCGADQSIVLLAKHCLAVDPAARPMDAGVLSQMVTECLEGLQDRTKQIEVTRVKMETRLIESEARERLARRARRLARMLAVAGVTVAALLAAGLGWYANDRIVRESNEEQRRTMGIQQIEVALAEAEQFEKQALVDGSTTHRRDMASRQAAAACQRAEALLSTTSNPPEELRTRYETVKSRVTSTERSTQLAIALEDWRNESFDVLGDFSAATAAKACRETLSACGFDALGRSPTIVAAEIKVHPAGTSIRELLKDWLAVSPDPAERQSLVAVLTESGVAPNEAWIQSLDSLEIEPVARLVDISADSPIPASGLALAAKRLEAASRPVEAERLLIRGVRRYPNDFSLNAQLGIFLRANTEGRSDAIRYLTAARAARPTNAIVNLELGNALADAGRTDEAIEILRDSLKGDAKRVAAHCRLGQLLESQGENDAALECFHRAVELEPGNREAQLGLGRTELAKDNLEGAEKAFQAAAQLGSSGETFAGLGRVFLKKFEAAKAIAAFQQAVEAVPSNVEYRLGLVSAYQISNDTPSALREARETARRAPTSAAAQRKLGELLKASGDNLAAIVAFRAATQADPMDAETFVRLAVLCEIVDDPTGAAEAYRAAADLRPNDPKLAANAARLLIKKGDHLGAVEKYRQILENEPENVAIRQKLARLLADRGDESAVEILTKAVEIEPKSGELQVELGEMLLRFGNFRSAARTFRSAAEKLPADSPLHDSARALARNASRWAGLESRLAEILSGAATASAPSAWADFGEVCQRTKRYAAAAKFFGNAAEGDAKYAPVAAICAALAGFGHGIDVKDLTSEQRAELRKRALADLKKSKAWASDSALFPIRNSKAIGTLPESERESWSKLLLAGQDRK